MVIPRKFWFAATLSAVISLATTPVSALGLTRAQLTQKATEYAFTKSQVITESFLWSALVDNLVLEETPRLETTEITRFVDIYQRQQTLPLLEVEQNVCLALRTGDVEQITPLASPFILGLSSMEETEIADLLAKYTQDELLYVAFHALKGYALAHVDNATQTTCPQLRPLFLETGL